MNKNYQLGFVGAGNMAQAIAKGILKSNLLGPDDILMSNLEGGNFDGIEITNNNQDIFDRCKYIIFAIKPQVFDQICSDFGKINAKAIVSIMAGKSVQTLKSKLDTTASIVRVMPNAPCMVCKGMSVIATNDYDQDINDFVASIFKSTGEVMFLDENLFDSVTSISGSGPAYVYYFIKSMIDAGVGGGLDQKESAFLTMQTFKGAIEMVEHSSDNLDILIDKVCSKGGTTIQAINSFDKDNVDIAIKKGIELCKKRSEELSK